MSTKIQFRTPYGPRVRQPLDFKGDDGRTIQEQKDACDINNILERYARTGLIDHVAKHEPLYAEFAEFDYQANQNMIAKINQSFSELPAKVRADFDNDPKQFLDFISTQENVDDMKDGIIGNEIPETGDEPEPEKQPEKAEKT